MPLLPRHVLAATAVGLAALLAGAGPALAAPTGPAAAAGWLAGALTDGDHLVYGTGDSAYAIDGSTADTVYALVAAGGHDDTLAALDSYLQGAVVSYADPEGTGPFGGGPYSGSLAKLALAAESTGRDPHSYGGYDLLKVLVDNECTATGNGCHAPGEFGKIYSPISQALGVLALQRSDVAADHLTVASAPVVRLLALRCADGLFSSTLLAPGTTCPTGDLDTSAYAAQALGAVLGAGDPAVTTTLDALVAAQDPSGGFDGASGMNSNTSGVVLSALSLRPADYAAAITKATTFVTGLQRADGAYAVSATDASDDSAKVATPQALLGVLGRNLADPTLVTTLPTAPPTTTPPTSTPPSSTAPTSASTGPTAGVPAPATGTTPELAATGAANGHLGSEVLLALVALVGGGTLVRVGARRLPGARHRA